MVVSPRNYFVFTPLLASTCVGTLEFRCVTEPIRRLDSLVQYHQAFCTNVDFDKRLVLAKSAIPGDSDEFSLPYDKLVIASGAVSNTFGIAGVTEHAFFLKDIADARRIRHQVLECFERAMQPNVSDEERRQLLHFAIVGGGPTGIEFAAELHDFVLDDMSRIYPTLHPFVRITVYDVADRILGSFDERLAGFATERFRREGIRVETRTSVRAVGKDYLQLGDGRTIPMGMLVWATGLAPSPLNKTLACQKEEKSGRVLIDERLNLVGAQGEALREVFAIGDCAVIRKNALPCTAQVAKQQAQYLAKQLSSPSNIPFIFNPLGMMAYIGGWRAVADIKEQKVSGRMAWLVWRSAYFSMAVSIKNKILIPMYWFLTWIFGRDISNI